MDESIKKLPYKVFKMVKRAEGNYTEEQRQAAQELLRKIIAREAAAAYEREHRQAEDEELPITERYMKVLGVSSEFEVLTDLLQDPEGLSDIANSDGMLPMLVSGNEDAARAILQQHALYLRNTEFTTKVIMAGPEEPANTTEEQRKETAQKLVQRLATNNPEAIDHVKLYIRVMITAAMDNKKVVESPEGQLFIDTLAKLWEAIQEHSGGDKLQLFLQQQVEYLAVHRPSGLIDLLGIDGKPTEEPIIRDLGRVQFTYDGRFGEKEKKILRAVDLWLAENNYSGARRDLNTYVLLPLKDTMRMLGMAVTPDNTRQFKARLMSKRGGILQNIKRGHIDIDDGHGTGIHAEIGTGSYSVSIPRDQIIFQVSDAYAAYQNTAPLGQYHSKTLYLRGLAFIIADKLQDQYFRYGNRSRGTHNIISIKKLLEFLEDALPSYETVSRGHWVDRIREPLEDALNQIQAAGLFKWEYCKRGMGEVTVQELGTKDYRKWAALYITYMLIPAEPYTEEQIQNRQQRIEEAREKKMLKDAETIVKAERIKKRQRRKKKTTEEPQQEPEQPEEQQEV